MRSPALLALCLFIAAPAMAGPPNKLASPKPVDADFVSAVSRIYPGAIGKGQVRVEDHGKGPVLVYWGLDGPVPDQAAVMEELAKPTPPDEISELRAAVSDLRARVKKLEGK